VTRVRRTAVRQRTGRIGLIIGVVIAALMIGTIVIGSIMWDLPPSELSFTQKLQGPSWQHPLGTDQFGRDQFARLLDGGRRSLSIAALILAGVVTASLVLGVLAGLAGGVVDSAISRAVDVLLSIPSTLLALALVGMLGPGLVSLMIAMMTSLWAGYTRIARSLTVAARNRGDVLAARQAGRGWIATTHGHIVPGVVSQLLVLATLDIGGVLAAIASLSFLGLGVQSPDAEWGSMLSESRLFLTNAPWLLAAPTAAIVLAVLAANLIGESIHDRLVMERT